VTLILKNLLFDRIFPKSFLANLLIKEGERGSKNHFAWKLGTLFVFFKVYTKLGNSNQILSG
jgi:hypothetical protein